VVEGGRGEVSVIFKWLHRRGKREQDLLTDTHDSERDSGEEEYESEEELEDEVAPSGLPRAKTDNI
jgi:hypothetical protein